MTRKELLSSKEYWTTQIQLNLYNLIEDYRLNNNLNKSQLAGQLGVTKSYITQVLNGDFDHKVSKLIELSLAFNKVPILAFHDIQEYLMQDSYCSFEAAPFKLIANIKPKRDYNSLLTNRPNYNNGEGSDLNYNKKDTALKVA